MGLTATTPPVRLIELGGHQGHGQHFYLIQRQLSLSSVMRGKSKKQRKGSPTGVRNFSERKNFSLSAALKARVEAISPLDHAGALTGKRDPNKRRQGCHGYPRSSPPVVIYRLSTLCNETLHVQSSTNIFLESPNERVCNNRRYHNLSPTREQWDAMRDFFNHNIEATPNKQKKLFDVMPKGELRRYKLVFNGPQDEIVIYYDPITGEWTPDSPTTLDPETTAFVLTPYMALHLLWVVIARVATCMHLESVGKYYEDNFDEEQVALDAEMKEFCAQMGLFDPMALDEYREMIACGWINADDVKNYRKCRGKDREVPLYDPQTGELVNPYRGKDGNWPLSVDPSIVQLSGELMTDDEDFYDSYADATPDLNDENDEDKRVLEITYDSNDVDASPRLPSGSINTYTRAKFTTEPGQNLFRTLGPPAARDSRSSPTPAPDHRQRKKARRLSPQPSPTRDNAPAAKSTNPSRCRTRPTAPVSPEPFSPSLLSSDPLDLLNHPSSPDAASTVDLSSDPLDTLTRHRPSATNARAGPSTLETSSTQVLRKFASKRHDYLVPFKAVQRPTGNRSAVASGSKQRTGKKKSAKTMTSQKGKRKREEDEDDET